jgi:hypothetical protein
MTSSVVKGLVKPHAKVEDTKCRNIDHSRQQASKHSQGPFLSRNDTLLADELRTRAACSRNRIVSKRYASFAESDALTFPSHNASNITTEFDTLQIPEHAVSESPCSMSFSVSSFPYLWLAYSARFFAQASSSSFSFSPLPLVPNVLAHTSEVETGPADCCGRDSLDSCG